MIGGGPTCSLPWLRPSDSRNVSVFDLLIRQRPSQKTKISWRSDIDNMKTTNRISVSSATLLFSSYFLTVSVWCTVAFASGFYSYCLSVSSICCGLKGVCLLDGKVWKRKDSGTQCDYASSLPSHLSQNEEMWKSPLVHSPRPSKFPIWGFIWIYVYAVKSAKFLYI